MRSPPVGRWARAARARAADARRAWPRARARAGADDARGVIAALEPPRPEDRARAARRSPERRLPCAAATGDRGRAIDRPRATATHADARFRPASGARLRGP